jgi:hypothetical protein
MRSNKLNSIRDALGPGELLSDGSARIGHHNVCHADNHEPILRIEAVDKDVMMISRKGAFPITNVGCERSLSSQLDHIASDMATIKAMLTVGGTIFIDCKPRNSLVLTGRSQRGSL